MKFYRIIILLILALNLSMNVNAHDSDDNVILFSADFNEGTDVEAMGFALSGNKNSSVVKEDFLGDSPALKISLDRFNDEVSYRSEVVPRGIHAIIGSEYWYSFRIYFPNEWEFDKTIEIIAQWHGSPDFELGEDWRSPPLALLIGEGRSGEGKNYLLNVRADSKEVTPDKDGENSYSFYKRYDLGPLAFDLGKWTQWVFHIKWSYEDDGFIQIWQDGNKIFDLDELSNAFNDKKGPYPKLGIYKWLWKNASYNIDVDHRVLFYDDIKIGNSMAKYEDLLPDSNNQSE